MTAAARGPGRGKLRALRRGGAVVYQGDWIDHDGARHRRVLSADRATALRILNTLVRRRDLEDAGMGSEVGLDRPFRELANLYLADMERRAKKPHTIETYKRALARIEREIPLATVRDITKGRVLSWRDGRIDGGASNKTANTEVGALRAALGFAVERELLGIHPLAGLRDLSTAEKHVRRPPRALSDDEVARLLRAADAHDARERHPRAGTIPRAPLIRALIATGGRWNEVINTAWVDFDPDRLELRFRITKSGKPRTIPLKPEFATLLAGLRQINEEGAGRAMGEWDRIFLTPRGRCWPQHTGNFRKYLLELFVVAGIPRRDADGKVANVHSMRHTFATRCARARVPVKAAQRLLGHATARMTLEVYSHAGDDDAKNGIALLPPLP